MNNNQKTIYDLIEKLKDVRVHFLVYKKIFTPYEQEQKFVDESEFADTHYQSAYLTDAFYLNNGDYLLEFQLISEGLNNLGKPDLLGVTEYHKLSDIRLSLCDYDEDY